jgi:hypothetical protein
MMQPVFVNSENKAIFTCPKCTKAKTVDISKLDIEKKKLNIRVKCTCGHIYPVVLERRKFYRKKTSLPGVFISEQNMKEFSMTVTNISRFGLEFNSSESEKLKVGDRIGVEFRLDDKSRSLIRKKIIIRKIEGKTVGAEFSFPDEYDKTLGFYLFR